VERVRLGRRPRLRFLTPRPERAPSDHRRTALPTGDGLPRHSQVSELLPVCRQAARNFRVPDSSDHVLVLLTRAAKKSYFAACGFGTL
jgi:hypothetical protein